MIPLLRSLVVWLMLLAMPVQGYASATMTACAPSAHAAHAAQLAMAPFGVHDHAAMLAAAHGDHGAHVVTQHDAQHQHGHGKCGDCAACCLGAALPPAVATVAPPSPGELSAPMTFYADALPAVDLAHPERPPQAPRA